MKLTSRTILFVLILALALSACGSAAPTSTPPAETPTATGASMIEDATEAPAAPANSNIILATTTSTQDSGLLDEPFAALDPPTRSKLLDDLHTFLPETGATTVFVTHNLVEAERLATHMAVFSNSRMQQAGLPEHIRLSPSNVEVANFFAQACT